MAGLMVGNKKSMGSKPAIDSGPSNMKSGRPKNMGGQLNRTPNPTINAGPSSMGSPINSAPPPPVTPPIKSPLINSPWPTMDNMPRDTMNNMPRDTRMPPMDPPMTNPPYMNQDPPIMNQNPPMQMQSNMPPPFRGNRGMMGGRMNGGIMGGMMNRPQMNGGMNMPQMRGGLRGAYGGM